MELEKRYAEVRKEGKTLGQTSQVASEATNMSQKRGIKRGSAHGKLTSQKKNPEHTQVPEMEEEMEETPVLSLKGERDLGSPAVQAVRRDLSPDVRKVFDFFVDVLRRSEIKNFDHELTSVQKSECTLVTDMVDWDLVADDFEQEVHTYKFLTFDLEKYMPSPASVRIPKIKKSSTDVARILYAHFATITGRTVIFDLEALNGEPVSSEDPLEVLPADFRHWIASPDIVVAGSAVRDDVLDVNWQGNKLANTIEVFKKAMAPRGNDPPLVDVGSRSKPGLGTQSFYAKSFNFKPMRREEFEKLYGNHEYLDEHGNKRWPRFRNKFFLYKWPKHNGRLLKECVYYMYHDATTPAALVARLFVDRCLAGQAEEDDTPVAAAISNTLDVKYGFVEAADTLQVSAPDGWDEDWEDSSLSVSGSSSAIHVSSSSGDRTIEISSSSQVRHLNKQRKNKRVHTYLVRPPMNRTTKGQNQSDHAWKTERREKSQRTSLRGPPLPALARRSCAPGSPNPERTSASSARSRTGATPTPSTRPWGGAARTAESEDTATRRRRERFCAKNTWATTPTPTSVPTADATTPPSTGQRPAPHWSTGAASATIEVTTRRTVAGTGVQTSGSQRGTSSSEWRIGAASPCDAGTTNAGGSSATSGKIHSHTSPDTTGCSRCPFAKSTSGWVSPPTTGPRGSLVREKSPSTWGRSGGRRREAGREAGVEHRGAGDEPEREPGEEESETGSERRREREKETKYFNVTKYIFVFNVLVQEVINTCMVFLCIYGKLYIKQYLYCTLTFFRRDSEFPQTTWSPEKVRFAWLSYEFRNSVRKQVCHSRTKNDKRRQVQQSPTEGYVSLTKQLVSNLVTNHRTNDMVAAQQLKWGMTRERKMRKKEQKQITQPRYQAAQPAQRCSSSHTQGETPVARV